MTSSTERATRRMTVGLGAARRFDEHHPPVAGAGRRLRALRVLPADLPHVHAVGRGDGLPARPDLPDEEGLEGEPMTDSMVQHFDACLGLHGLRDRLPVRRPVRQAHRGDPRAGRAATTTAPRQDRALRAAIFALFPHPRRLRLLRGRCARYQRTGLHRRLRRTGCSSGSRPQLAAMESLAPRAATARAAARARAAPRARGGPSSAAHRLRAARVLPRRQRRHRPRARRRGLRRGRRRRRRAAAARCRCTTAARRRRSASPAR